MSEQLWNDETEERARRGVRPKQHELIVGQRGDVRHRRPAARQVRADL